LEEPLIIFFDQMWKISLKIFSLVEAIARSLKHILVLILLFLTDGNLFSTKCSQV